MVSALPPKADIRSALGHVRFVPIADIVPSIRGVAAIHAPRPISVVSIRLLFPHTSNVCGIVEAKRMLNAAV